MLRTQKKLPLEYGDGSLPKANIDVWKSLRRKTWAVSIDVGMKYNPSNDVMTSDHWAQKLRWLKLLHCRIYFFSMWINKSKRKCLALFRCFFCFRVWADCLRILAGSERCLSAHVVVHILSAIRSNEWSMNLTATFQHSQNYMETFWFFINFRKHYSHFSREFFIFFILGNKCVFDIVCSLFSPNFSARTTHMAVCWSRVLNIMPTSQIWSAKHFCGWNVISINMSSIAETNQMHRNSCKTAKMFANISKWVSNESKLRI